MGCPPSLQKLGVLCPEHCVACYSSHSCLPSHSCSRSPAPSMPAQRAQTTFVICHTTSSVEVLPLTSLRHCLTMVPHWRHLSQAHVDCLHAINCNPSVSMDHTVQTGSVTCQNTLHHSTLLLSSAPALPGAVLAPPQPAHTGSQQQHTPLQQQ